MPKRPSAFDASQLGFTFAAPHPSRRRGDLAGLDRRVASAVAEALKADERSREEIAGKMSALLGEDVSRWMLDGYASEARDNVNISFGRMLALIAATERFDILDEFVARIGGRVLVGDEIEAARLGHLDAQIAELRRQRGATLKVVQPIVRERRW